MLDDDYDPPRVAPSVPRVDPIGSTAEKQTGEVTAAERTEKRCVIGEYCRKHGFIHGAEAEELREAFEKFTDPRVHAVLERIDARDSCAFLEPSAACGGVASSLTQISNRCPACGNQTLFIAEGGWLTCSWLTCPNPCALREIADGYRRQLIEAAGVDSALTSAALPHDVDSLTKRGHMLIDSWPMEWQRAFWRNLLVAGGTTISPTPEQEVPVENRDLYGSCRACHTATWCWLFQTCLTRAAPIGAFQGPAAPVRPVQEQE